MMLRVGVAMPYPVVEAGAEAAAWELARLAQVLAVCVVGSSARGDYEEGSDIDLVALVHDRATATAVRASFGRERMGRRVQLRLLSEAGLTRLFERRSTFGVHVLREGVVLYDPHGRFATLRAPHSRDGPVRDDGAMLRIRLEPYEDLAWCQGLYLYCLSDLYSIGRAAAFTILGRESRFEFSGTRALAQITHDFPALEMAATRIAALRPYFLLVERNRATPLPFPYRDCHREARDATEATRALVDALR
jgi:predicted nucleotidyltransferase